MAYLFSWQIFSANIFMILKNSILKCFYCGTKTDFRQADLFQKECQFGNTFS